MLFCGQMNTEGLLTLEGPRHPPLPPTHTRREPGFTQGTRPLLERSGFNHTRQVLSFFTHEGWVQGVQGGPTLFTPRPHTKGTRLKVLKGPKPSWKDQIQSMNIVSITYMQDKFPSFLAHAHWVFTWIGIVGVCIWREAAPQNPPGN